MWCVNCQHGHEPVMREDKLLGKFVSVCPCCGALLDPKNVKTKEQELKEYAAKLGLDVDIKSKEKAFVVGVKEEKIEVKKESVAEKARKASAQQ